MTKAYVLITPARNEASFLPGLIDSIAAQTVLPLQWIIVSDNSTDATDAIASAAAAKYPYIFFVRAENKELRSFGSKAKTFRIGYNAIQATGYDFIGNLDADITLEANYYESMLAAMHRNPKLGVASGICWDKTATGFKKMTISLNHAVGAVQFFRRPCFEAIGGYQSTSVGGVDSLAELTARMMGWQTQAFPELPVFHHKPVDSAGGRSAMRICYRAGMTEYHIGSHPLFAFVKAVRRWRSPPTVLSVFARLYGYFTLLLSGKKRDASEQLVIYLKHEQLTILKNFVLRRSQD